MQDYSERRTIAYPADDLYEIVADVESYPKFLPWCVDARVVEKNDGIIIADLMIGFNALREKFRSIVELNRAELSVSSRQEKGPFQHLESRWLFTPSSETETMVDFTLSAPVCWTSSWGQFSTRPVGR